MISTNDLKNGMVLDLDGQLWSVVWFQHHKPGKGNTVVRTKLKHVLSGKVVDKTFNSDIKVDTANVDRREMQYLYHDGAGFVFMDTASYEQMTIPDETVADAKNYLLEEQTATVAIHEDNPLYIDLPASVELEITYTEPGLQGDRSTGGTKPATLQTGLQIQVPLFLTTGEKVKVDTRTGGLSGPDRQLSPKQPASDPAAVGVRFPGRSRCATVAGPSASRHSTRSKARKRALDILFEAELRGNDVIWTLSERSADAEPPVRDYTTELVEGVHRQPAASITGSVTALASGWTLARLPRVDRIALQIAVFELDELGGGPGRRGLRGRRAGLRPLHRRFSGLRQRRPGHHRPRLSRRSRRCPGFGRDNAAEIRDETTPERAADGQIVPTPQLKGDCRPGMPQRKVAR